MSRGGQSVSQSDRQTPWLIEEMTGETRALNANGFTCIPTWVYLQKPSLSDHQTVASPLDVEGFALHPCSVRMWSCSCPRLRHVSVLWTIKSNQTETWLWFPLPGCYYFDPYGMHYWFHRTLVLRTNPTEGTLAIKNSGHEWRDYFGNIFVPY